MEKNKRRYIKGVTFRSTLVCCLVLISALSFGQNVELDKKLGAENAILVEQQFGIDNNQELTEYVASIGNRLVAQLDKNPFEFSFQVADDPIPNAFALPGGYIYVTRGLLALVLSEDELACVMAHEVIHVIERHSVKQMRSAVLPSLLEVPGNIVGSVVSNDLGNLINAPISTSNALLLSSYGRSQETESDTKGIQLAAKAGYDPIAMSGILMRLTTAIEELTNQRETKSYFDDHPYTPKRVEKISKTAADIEWTASKPIEPGVPSPLEGMLFGYNPAKGVIKENKFLHPGLGFAIDFPESWQINNQPTNVTSIHPDRQAAIVLGLEDPKLSPQKHGELFTINFSRQYGKVPYKSGPHTVNGQTGYLFSVVDNSGSEPMYIHILWLKLNGNVFKLIGFAPKILESDLQQTAESLSTLSASESSTIEIYTIGFVEANKYESLRELDKRSGNVSSIELTAIMNGVSEDVKLEKNQIIKIVKKNKYRTK